MRGVAAGWKQRWQRQKNWKHGIFKDLIPYEWGRGGTGRQKWHRFFVPLGGGEQFIPPLRDFAAEKGHG